MAQEVDTRIRSGLPLRTTVPQLLPETAVATWANLGRPHSNIHIKFLSTRFHDHGVLARNWHSWQSMSCVRMHHLFMIVLLWTVASVARGEQKLQLVYDTSSRAQEPDLNQNFVRRGHGGIKLQCESPDSSSYSGLTVDQSNGTVFASSSDGTFKRYGGCWQKLSGLYLKKLVTAFNSAQVVVIFGIGVNDGKVYRGIYENDAYSFSAILEDTTYTDLLMSINRYSSPYAYCLGAVSSSSVRTRTYQDHNFVYETTIARDNSRDKAFFLSNAYLCQSTYSSGAITCSETYFYSSAEDTSAATSLETLVVPKVTTACGNNYGIVFVTDSLSKVQIYSNSYGGSGFISTPTVISTGKNSWVVTNCVVDNSAALTFVTSSRPSAIKTYSATSATLVATNYINGYNLDFTAASFVASLQAWQFYMAIPGYSIQPIVSNYANDDVYYYGNGLHFQDEFAIVYGFYLLYFFGLVIIAQVLDWSRLFDDYVIPIARSCYVNTEDRLLKDLFRTAYLKAHPEVKDRLQQNPGDDIDWEDSEVLNEYLAFIAHRKLLAAAEDEMLSQQLRQQQEQQNAESGVSRFCRWCYNALTCRQTHQHHQDDYRMPAWFFNAIRDKLFLNTAVYDSEDRREYLKLCCWKMPFAKGYWSDLFFFIANNHTTFSSFLATPGDTYSRNGRRLTYLCVNCFTLFVVIVLKSTIPIPPTYKKIITIFFVSPAIIFVRKSFFYMLACPCIDRDAPQPSFVTRTLMSTGATSAYLYGGLYLGVLLVAALFTPGKGEGQQIAAKQILLYSYSVNIISCIQETLLNFQTFGNGESVVLLRLFGRYDVKLYGSYYYEKVKALHLVGRDYHDVKVEDRALLQLVHDNQLKQLRQQTSRNNIDVRFDNSNDDDGSDREGAALVEKAKEDEAGGELAADSLLVVKEKYAQLPVEPGDATSTKKMSSQKIVVTFEEGKDVEEGGMDSTASPDTRVDARVDAPVDAVGGGLELPPAMQVPSLSPSDRLTNVAPLTPTATAVVDIEQGHNPNDYDIHATASAAPELAGSAGKRALLGKDADGEVVNDRSGPPDARGMLRQASTMLIARAAAATAEGVVPSGGPIMQHYDYVERDLTWVRWLTCGQVVATSWTDKQLYSDMLLAAIQAQMIAESAKVKLQQLPHLPSHQSLHQNQSGKSVQMTSAVASTTKDTDKYA